MERKFALRTDIYFAVIFILLLLFVSTYFSSSQTQKEDVTYGATPNSSTSWTSNSNYYDTDWQGDGTEAKPYRIYTAEELAGLAYQVDNGNTYEGVYFSQMANIDLIDHYWEPIGDRVTDRYSFNGYYNGNYCTITNLIVSTSENWAFPGLFSYIDGATIRNITISNSYISSYGGLGFVAGYAINSIIENCHSGSNNQFVVNDLVFHYIYVGGVVGYTENCIVRNCSNISDITIPHIDDNNYTGGVIGYAVNSQVIDCSNEGDVTCTDWVNDNQITQAIGGICGNVDYTTISGCYNEGNVSGADDVGGITGRVHSWSNTAVTIINCYNNGDITGPYIAGGIVGVGYGMNNNLLYISNCFNTATVLSQALHNPYGGTQEGYAGGICGHVTLAYINITNSFNVGRVYCSNSAADCALGGILGSADSSVDCVLSNNYFGGDCTLSYGFGFNQSNEGCTFISTLNSQSYAKNREWYTSQANWNSDLPWDFDNVWSINSAQNNGYPYLNIRSYSYSIKYVIPSQLELSSSAPDTATYGEVVYIPSPTSVESGYSFAGWSAIDLNSFTAKYGGSYLTVTTPWNNEDTVINSNYFLNLASVGQTVYLVANVQASSYTVNVVYGNGTSNRTISAEYGTAFNLPVPVRTGYEFQGWRISGTYSLSSALQGVTDAPTETWSSTTSLPTSTYFSNLSIVDGATVTLTAQWAPGRYDITYDVNSSDAQYVGLNYALRTTDANFSDSGISISYDATDGLLTYNGTAQAAGTIGSSLEFEGEIPSIANFVVGYYRMDGSVVTLDRAQTKFWITFTWNNGTYNEDEIIIIDSGNAIEQDVFTMPTSSTVINRVAVYLVGSLGEKGYTYNNARYRFFIYDENYSGDNTQQILYGDTPAMGYAIRPGYVFSGWNTRADGKGTTYGPDNIGTITSDITLYAQWDKATYTVTFDGNGGTSELDRMDVEYLATFGSGNNGELPLAEKEGYVFKGWYLSADSAEEVTASTVYTYTDNITLCAQWEETWYDYGVKPEGEGSESSPYLIALPEHLAWLTNQVAKGNETEAYCRQIANIDMSNTKNVAEDKALEWFPIGTDSHPFKGYYNGNGYSISINSRGSQSKYYGLFGVTENATIEKIYFIGNNFTSGRTSGGVVAYAKGSTIVKDSYIELSLQRKIDTSSFTFGAIIGKGESGSVIENCSLVYYNIFDTEYPVANGDVEIRSVVYRYSKGDGNFDNLYIGSDFSGFSYVPYWTMPLPKNLTHLPTEEVTLDVIKTWAGE